MLVSQSYNDSDEVFRMSLDLDFFNNDPQQKLSFARVHTEPLISKDGNRAKLCIPDQFSNCGQVFFLRKPIRGIPRPREVSRHTRFNCRRYMAIVGKRALHVLDLELMQFITADERRGFD